MDGVDDLGAVDPLQVNRGDPEIRVPELPLDDDERHSLMRHLHGMRVTELMGREPSTHTRLDRGAAQLLASRRRLLVTTDGRATDHAQQRADR